MRACWEAKVRRDDPGARGEVTLAARVRADGAVVDVKVKRSAFVDRAFHGCLVDAARTWRFPPFDGVDDTVTYRVRFGTADSGPIGLPLVLPGSMPLPTEPASSSSAEPTTGTAVP
jgi:TonB family protein